MQEWLEKATVAHIAPVWLPLPREDRNYGGIEDVILNHFHALRSMGIKRQYIFGHPANKRMEYKYKRTKVFIPRDIPTSEDLLHLMRVDKYEAWNLERIYLLQAYNTLLKKRDFITIVHDHTQYGRDYGEWFSDGVLPVVHTEHGPMTSPDIPNIEERVLDQFKGMSNMGFIAISHNQKSHMKKLNWIGVNHNGIDLRDFSYNENKEDYLLFLGRVNKAKGVHNAIKVARSLNISLVIAGSIEETPESISFYEKEVAPFIDGRNIFHLENGVNASERQRLLKNARALLMLIEWDEPFGMVMPEALASGTPIVGYPRGSVPEVVKEGTGFVVRNLTEAKQAVRKILRGNYYPRKCRRIAEEFFSKEAMAARYINLYMKQENKFKRSLRQHST